MNDEKARPHSRAISFLIDDARLDKVEMMARVTQRDRSSMLRHIIDLVELQGRHVVCVNSQPTEQDDA